MTQPATCSACAEPMPPDAPQGLCPRCLLASALEPSRDAPDDTQTQALPGGVDLGEPGAAVLSGEVEGRYATMAAAGRGGMGRVWLVRDRQLGREVALKELLADAAGAADLSHPLAGRFLREARITAQLQHPSITPVYELGRRSDGSVYYTMKFVRGRMLSQAIRAARTFVERRRLLPHFVDLCQAIAYAHSRGVVHRDIKPGNVMIGDFGETVVVDWGLAKVNGPPPQPETPAEPGPDPTRPADATATAVGHALGTPSYMPPEQARGLSAQVNERSDIYSLGAVLYEILSGQRPYQGDSAAAVISSVLGGPPPPPHAVDAAVPQEYARICMRAMARDQQQRYSSALALAEDVERVRLQAPKRWARRVAETAAVVLALGLPLGVLIANGRSERQLRAAMERLASKGVDTQFSRPESFAIRPSLAAAGGGVGLAAPALLIAPSAVGSLYAFRWRFPDLADESSPFWRALGGLKAAPGATVSPEAERLSRTLVEENGPVIDALQEIVRLPRDRVDAVMRAAMATGSPFAAELPDFTALRAGALLLAHRARLSHQDGRSEAALDDLACILEISNRHADLPWLVSSLRRTLLADVALDGFARMSDGSSLTLPARPTAFEHALEAFAPRSELPRAVEGEVKSVLWAFDSIRNRARSDAEGRDGLSRGWIATLGWSLYGSSPLRFWLNGDQALYARLMADYAEATRRPYSEAIDELRRIDAEAAGYAGWRHPVMELAAVSVTPAVERAAHVESRVARARLCLALQRSRTVDGAYPESLDRLRPTQLSEVPLDPLSGRPFKYRRTPSGYSLEAPAPRER